MHGVHNITNVKHACLVVTVMCNQGNLAAVLQFRGKLKTNPLPLASPYTQTQSPASLIYNLTKECYFGSTA